MIKEQFIEKYKGKAVHCHTEELAKQAVAKVGEDRIKKYLFGVGV